MVKFVVHDLSEKKSNIKKNNNKIYLVETWIFGKKCPDKKKFNPYTL